MLPTTATTSALPSNVVKSQSVPLVAVTSKNAMSNNAAILAHRISSTVEIFDGSAITKSELTLPEEKTCTELVSQLCQRLLKSLEYNSVVEFIATHMIAITQSDGACVYSKRLHCKYGSHTEGCACAALQHIQRIIISSSTTNDPRFARHDRNISQHVILFPLHYRDEIIGSLLLSRKTKSYVLNDVESVLPMLEMCGKFVHKAGHSSRSRRPSIQQLKDVDDVKDKFLATMSHELRTPLNGIVGMVTLLGSAGPLNPKQTEYVSILLECSHQLMNLMNNILDFSKMASGRLVLARSPFSVIKTIRDSIIIASSKAKDKKLLFEVLYNGKTLSLASSVEEDEAVTVPFMLGDSQRLMQILINLLTNAVKFTDKGRITLRVNSEEYSSPENTFARKWKFSFDVEDTGIGIPLEEQSLIFDAFHQSNNQSPAVSKSGTGLGLSISKELVKLMGGTISVTSQGVKGLGSIFSFHVILEQELTLSSTSADYGKLFKKAKILVVDDRQENRLQISEMLFKWKCNPVILSSGEEALQYLKHDDKFSVGLIDICMPYMSGVELAQELRTSYPAISLIGLSSVDDPSSAEIFDHYLSKPIDQTKIFPAILSCLIEHKRRRGSHCNSSTSSLPHTPKEMTTGRKKKPKSKLRILIAEDDKNNAYTIKEMLYSLGYNSSRIKHVENGEECVKTLQEGKRKYDVVLLDILMPVMDGIEAAKHIRQSPQPRPYTIAVSAAVQKSDKQRCQDAGIDSYLTKPILIDRLAAVLSPLIVDGSAPRVSI